jgi:hypothetical protein
MDATNPHFKNKFASLGSILHAILPVLNKNGIALMQHPTIVDGKPALRTVLLHESGESSEDTMLLILDKENSQGQGSALTYARRYAVMSALGLVAEEDDDGQAASRPRVPRETIKPRKDYAKPSLSEIDDLTKAYAEILDKPRGTVLEKLTAKFPEWRNDEAQTKLAVEHMKKLLATGVAAA